MNRSSLSCLFAVAALTAATSATASCGSAFCTLMTDRYTQGTGEAHAGWSADVRLEALTQTRLRTGTADPDATQLAGEAVIERHTRNLNLLTSLSYGIDEDWSVVARVPLVSRDHLHDVVDPDTGLISGSEQWRFTKVGDVQVLARRQFSVAGGAQSFAAFGGLKLPTGSVGIANGDGTRAERALQPGSGTTDLVLGGAWRRAVGLTNAVVAQASLSQALNSKEEFKPGSRVEFSVGWSHAYSPSLGAVLQLNARRRERDSGAQSEPDNSGSTTVDLSPGLTFGVGQASTVYAYVQVPLYQRVNGIQLVPRSALALGWTSDF
jgi:hypothetical protein